jgi:hypothetical protein
MERDQAVGEVEVEQAGAHGFLSSDHDSNSYVASSPQFWQCTADPSSPLKSLCHCLLAAAQNPPDQPMTDTLQVTHR